MATTYICGDSFATEDPDYKEFYNLWHEQLDTDVENLYYTIRDLNITGIDIKKGSYSISIRNNFEYL